MVTRPTPERFKYALKSIEDYCRQSWARKTLTVVVDADAGASGEALKSHIADLGRDDIHVVSAQRDLNLGQLRNLSVEAAAGDLVCQWDDDDRYHPDRLHRQARALIDQGLDAVFLRDVMHYFPRLQEMYWTNWRAAPFPALPGSVMARRAAMPLYPTVGEVARLGEDSAVADALAAHGRVGFIEQAAPLYVYVTHGMNTFHAAHHRMLADSLGISRALLLRREALIREGLEPLGLPSGRIRLQGSNGEAFVL